MHPGAQPRPGMIPGMYSPHHGGQMPPPANHPAQAGFMMGHHHPGQPVYRQPMYGSGGMPPQHNMMPGPYQR